MITDSSFELALQAEFGGYLADLRRFRAPDDAVSFRHRLEKAVNAETGLVVETRSEPATGRIAATTIGDLAAVLGDFNSQDRLLSGERRVIDKDLFHSVDFLFT
jgi:hypothetical protein